MVSYFASFFFRFVCIMLHGCQFQRPVHRGSQVNISSAYREDKVGYTVGICASYKVAFSLRKYDSSW